MKKIGFIGQGWIGKNYADDFEERGFDVVRYSKDKKFEANKTKIADCDVVFIAVPTPTTTKGFDFSIIREVLPLVGKGKIAIIKSTILPGTSEVLQKEFPKIIILHSPEFLTEANARFEAAHPKRNILGLPSRSAKHKKAAKEVMKILPKAPFNQITDSKSSEFIKYAGNSLLYNKVVFVNILFNLASEIGLNWSNLKDAIIADGRLGHTHFDPLHSSGRGAGGHCFIKDFAAFRKFYEDNVSDKKGVQMLKALEEKNIHLLVESNKDIEDLVNVYGKKIIK